MASSDDNERIERRRRVVRAIKAMADKDGGTDELVQNLASDPDHVRVVGALAVAGATLARTLAQAQNRPVDDVLTELEEQLASAPVE